MPIKKWTPEDSIAMMDRLGIEVGIGSISEPGLILWNNVMVNINKT
jgi:hypothetical protein